MKTRLLRLGRAASRSRRIDRGGSWYYHPLLARVAYRGSFALGFRGNYLGVRLVEVLGDEQTSQA
jgi:formylglycine-generating enzyme required for sulfatase activity